MDMLIYKFMSNMVRYFLNIFTSNGIISNTVTTRYQYHAILNTRFLNAVGATKDSGGKNIAERSGKRFSINEH